MKNFLARNEHVGIHFKIGFLDLRSGHFYAVIAIGLEDEAEIVVGFGFVIVAFCWHIGSASDLEGVSRRLFPDVGCF